MALEYRGKPVCNQSSYWTHFIANFVAVMGLLGFAIYCTLSGSWGMAILAFLLIAPVGIYFRVIMVRRCRDIGWPTFLPWLTFGLGMLANMGRMAGGAAQALQPSPSAALLPLLVGSIDFIFMIVIGCIASKQPDYAAPFRGGDDDHYEPARRIGAEPAYAGPAYAGAASPAQRPAMPHSESDQEARWDAAIAAALAARQQGEPAPAAPMQRPAMPARTAGFGRKIV